MSRQAEAATIAAHSPDAAKEKRLERLRAEAEAAARTIAPGVRPVPGPFPLDGALPGGGPQSGYYGLPLVKHPPWIWAIPVYFFVGGAAGAAAVIAAVTAWRKGDERLERDAHRLAQVGSLLSAPLLITDLGRPARFLAMLRIVKLQSPMSVGAWVLTAFGGANSGATAFRLLGLRGRSRPVRLLSAGGATAFETAAGLLGLPMATFTGALVGVTAIPVWSRNVSLLPFHFGASGLASAVAILEIAGHRSEGLRRLGIATAVAETLVGASIEARGDVALQPLKRGRSGWMTRLGGVLSGPVPLAIRLFGGRNYAARVAAGACSIAGSVLTRFAWVEAGRSSAEDPRIPMDLERRPRARKQ